MDIEKYFLDICDIIAKNSTCIRAQVGAIIVKDNIIISSGYNTAPINQITCKEINYCYREKNKIKSGTQLEKCKAVGSHAECNAICNAAKNGIAIKNTVLYMTGHNFVCEMCKALIINSEIDYVITRNKNKEIIKYCPKCAWNKHIIEEE